MPRLWSETIEAHRQEVREATLDATAALVAEVGLRAVTMSQIAQRTGIGRATLYKYFPDVESILHAWHGRQIARHLEHLGEVRDQAGDPGERIESVLVAYALMSRGRRHHDATFEALLHRDEHVAPAHLRLRVLVRDLLAAGVEAGIVRGDVTPDELTSYCLHAIGAASALPSDAAVRRLVIVVLAGLRPSAGEHGVRIG